MVEYTCVRDVAVASMQNRDLRDINVKMIQVMKRELRHMEHKSDFLELGKLYLMQKGHIHASSVAVGIPLSLASPNI